MAEKDKIVNPQTSGRPNFSNSSAKAEKMKVPATISGRVIPIN